MADSYWIIPPDSTGKKLDAEQVTVGGVVVQRQRVVALTPAQIAAGLGTYFSATTPDVQALATGTVVAMLENPTASGKRVHLDTLTLDIGVNTAPAVLTVGATRTGGDAVTPFNLGGGSGAASSVFASGAISAIVLSGGTVVKRSRREGGLDLYFGGVLQLAAGSSLAVTYTPAATTAVTANFAWWEV